MVQVIQDPKNKFIFLVQSFNSPWKFYRVDLEYCSCTCEGWWATKEKSFAAFREHKHSAIILRLIHDGRISKADSFGIG